MKEIQNEKYQTINVFIFHHLIELQKPRFWIVAAEFPNMIIYLSFSNEMHWK